MSMIYELTFLLTLALVLLTCARAQAACWLAGVMRRWLDSVETQNLATLRTDSRGLERQRAPLLTSMHRLRSTWVGMFAVAAIAFPTAANAQLATLTAGGATYTIPAASHYDATQTSNFTGVGTGDYLFEDGWWFRVSGDTAESFFPVPTTSSAAGGSGTIRWTDVNARGLFSATNTLTLTSTTAGTGELVLTMSITNLSEVSPLTISLFHGADFDVNGTAGSDSATLLAANSHIRIQDATAGFSEYKAFNPAANAFLVRPFASTTDVFGLLGNTVVNNFDNSGLPASSFDFTGAFQWDLVIPANGTRSVSVELTGNIALPVSSENAPTVTINQAAGQADPTNASPINFTVVFSEPVTDFDDVGDVTLSGTAGATTALITGGPTTYNVAVSGMTGNGTVIASIPANAAQNAVPNLSSASTSTDNTATYDTTAPDTTITGQPTNPSNSSSAAFSFTGDDGTGSGIASFEVNLDGGGFVAGSSPTNDSGLSEGAHTFQVRAIDNAGNTDPTPASYTWTVDAMNDAPSFTKGGNQSHSDGTTTQSISNWATLIDDGNSSQTQALTFNVSNNNNALFTLQPAIDSSTGTLTYTPAGIVGTAIVSVSLTDDDSLGGPGTALTSAVQTFTISIVLGSEIAVSGNSLEIANGDGTPSLTDHTQFGGARVAGGTVVRTFTIRNPGTAVLNLTGTPKVVLSGTHAGDFSVTTVPTSPVAIGGSTTFQVTFNPRAIGTRSATLSIANNDSNEAPYTFSIQGAGFNYDVPELMYYQFDGTGTTVPNHASAPVGTNPATIQGGLTQGGTGEFGGGLIGSGSSSTSDYLNTGWATNLSGSWTISLYLNNIQPSSTLFYFFGDLNSNSFRCFTNGVAGPNNLILRGTGITDVLVNGAATASPNVTTFVYDAEANQIRAYLNGVLVNTVAQSSPVITGRGPFKVNGYSSNVGNPAGGVIDEFRLYNRALSDNEISDTWNVDLYKVPEIAVSGNSTDITNGDSAPGLDDHTDFGSKATAAGTVTRTFTIANSGTAELTLSGTPKVVIDGPHAADFTVTLEPDSPVAAEGTTTFTLTFNPSADGLRTATVSIDNDDATENPFNFSIQGAGTSPAILPGVVLGGPPKLNPTTGLMEHIVRVTNNTEKATDGVRLAITNLIRPYKLYNSTHPTLPIIEVCQTIPAGASIDIKVAIYSPTRKLGSWVPTYTITSMGVTTISPETLTLPSAGASYDITVTSTGVWSVSESIPWATVSTTDGAMEGIVTVTLLPNATKLARSGIIKIGCEEHSITQSGVIKPVLGPLVGPFPAIISGPFSLVIPTANLPVSRYIATGLPDGLTLNAAGIITGVPTQVGVRNVTVTASNAAGTSLPLSFVINVAALPAGVVGTFHGFVERSTSVFTSPNPNIGARFEMLTSSNGTVTGKIIEGATSKPFAGKLVADVSDPDHPVLNTVVTGTALTLELDFDATTNAATGFLHDTGTAKETKIDSWRNVWHVASPGNPANLATVFKAQHNFALANLISAGPQGYSYGSFTVNENTGALTLAGKLADGSILTGTTFIGQNGDVLIYKSLYANRGSLLGFLIVQANTAPVADNNIIGFIDWFKPAALSSADTVYNAGFGPLLLDTAGGTYTPPSAGQRIMGLPLATSPALNASLDFTDGGLSPNFSQLLRISSPAVVAFGSPYNNSVKLVITAPTGQFSGSFTLPGSPARLAPFYGQVVKTSIGTFGFGHFLLPQIPSGMQTLNTSPKLSGAVELLPYPTIMP